MSGLLIVLLGLAVLICGGIGFSEVERSRSKRNPNEITPGTTAAAPTTTGAVAAQAGADVDAQAAAIKPNPATTASESEIERELGFLESLLLAIYETLQLFSFNADAEPLHGSAWLRWAAFLAVILAVALASKGITLLFHDSYVAFQLWRNSGHIVICGLGRIGRQLIEDLLERHDPRSIVVIEPDPENPTLRWARDCGVLVVIGDSTKRESLEDAGVHRASELFVTTGSDSCNIECVVELRDYLKKHRPWLAFWKRTEPLRCYVHVLDRDLAEIVRARTGDLG